ncbi:MAG: 5-oxoprolinase (ATP-hydrolyzing), partial [Myxococcota bacterium]
HLPDITVIRPIFIGDRRLGFVAARGHHVDVGGIQPGSMPPHATHIGEEGLILSQVLISDGARFLPPPLPGCRQPDEVRADLIAQIAACEAGASLLVALAVEQSAAVVTAQLGHLMARAGAVVADHLPRLAGTHTATEILDDGTPITVTLTVTGRRGHLTIDAPAHPGNLNAPRAVAIAALLYVFRCLVDSDLPLSEGALRPLTLTVTPGGLLDPSFPAAVAGGNVETSQRLVDALLRALGAQAGSQGTMNNLTVGTPTGAFYETIGGGSGAGPGFDGAHAVQVHMTNTAATDVEELEARFPVRLEEWARRTGSGGDGRWRGGDGCVRVWRFLAPAEVALLAGRRDRGAPGLVGGGDGAPGCDERDVGNGWEPAPPTWTAKAGDRLRIATPGGGGAGR